VGVASKIMSRVPVRLLIPAIAWQYQFYEPELRRLDEFVPGDRGAVDVGMWWGPWSWWLARRLPQVDSFEPNPELCGRLASVMPRNVAIHQVALSDRTSQANLWVPSDGMGTEGRDTLEPAGRPTPEWNKHTVATSRLDDFNLEDVGFVKIDVEGHELAVLQGATDLLAAERPTVMIEIEEHSNHEGRLDKVIEFFDDRSYGGRFLHKGHWYPIHQVDRQVMREMAKRVAQHSYGANLVLYARRYVHNFVFSPN
jgi:FkbM family methyltransferase